MLEKAGPERFGLVRSPFQDLAGEGLDDALALHVDQEADSALQAIKEDVLEGRRKAAVVLVGTLGSGKTHRLRVAADEARHVEAFCVEADLTGDASAALAGLCAAIRAGTRLGAFARLNAPKWYRDAAALERRAQKEYVPEDAGRVLAEALNANAPAFVLLNDLQNLRGGPAADRFLHALHALLNHLRPGALVMLGCYPETYEALRTRHAALTTRVDRVLHLATLTDEEAQGLVARRLPAARIVDGLDALYPFTPEAVQDMNRVVHGNPRRLLKLADLVLELAVKERVFRITPDAVRAVVERDPTVRQWATNGAAPRRRTIAPASRTGPQRTRPTD